ncbi:MAG: CPBP family intramembrane metalloprotease [Bradymonadales bacterium]|nr:CPBP family intramembrane metalloprotease [Bradymonadales bacterium]
MSRQTENSTYVVGFADGRASEPLDYQTVRLMIENGQISTCDRISRDGSPLAEFYLYDEFVDLWDVDSDHLGLYDEHPGAGPQNNLATASVAAGNPLDREPSDEQAALADVSFLEELPTNLVSSSDFESVESPIRPAVLDEKIVEEAMPPPLVVPGFQTGSPVGNEKYPPPEPLPTPLDGGFSPAPLAPPPTASGEFRGYDPLQDTVLDPLTVFDLLVDSSLFTVLAVSRHATAEQIHQAYLDRVGQLAALQRQSKQTDRAQVAALEGIRRLLFQTQEVLCDPEKRRQYEQAGGEGGGFPPAGSYLGIGSAGPEGDQPSGASQAAAISSVLDEMEAAGDLVQEPTRPPGPEPSAGERPSWQSNGRRDRSQPQSTGGLRLYTSPFDAIANPPTPQPESPPPRSRPVSDSPPRMRPGIRRERDERRAAARRGAGKTAVDDRIPPGLRWGSDEYSRQGLVQVLGLTALAAIVSLAVVLLTDLGASELDYSSPSAWFFGRIVLLLVLAVVGTVAVRKEPLSSLGFGLSARHLAAGAGVGVVLGLVGSRLAPIYVEGSPLLWGVVMLLMLAETLSHEAFFRGTVTRVLLVGFKTPAAAIALSCVLYGLFYLTYWNVLQIRGYYLFYYSVLLFGFGVGGLYASLYYWSKSLWPVVVAHFFTVALSALLGP